MTQFCASPVLMPFPKSDLPASQRRMKEMMLGCQSDWMLRHIITKKQTQSDLILLYCYNPREELL